METCKRVCVWGGDHLLGLGLGLGLGLRLGEGHQINLFVDGSRSRGDVRERNE